MPSQATSMTYGFINSKLYTHKQTSQGAVYHVLQARQL